MSPSLFATLKAALATFAVGFSITGCGGGDPEDTPTATESMATPQAVAQPVSATGVIAIGSAVQTATTTGVVNGASTARRSGAGLNLGPWSYYQPDLPTLDLMKKASPWLTQCAASNPVCAGFAAGASAWDTKEQAALPLDSQGWVKQLPVASDTSVKFRSVSTLVFSGGYQPPGRYVVLYKGKGTLQYNGAGSKIAAESTPGRDIVMVKNDTNAAFWLTITATLPTDYLRDIRIYAPGGVCAKAPSKPVDDAKACNATTGAFVANETLAQSELFHPAYLSDVTGFRTLRFMDWGRTNFSQVALWKDRPHVEDRTWATANGVPLETALALAVKASADPWINVPTLADDDYVRQFARIAKARLPAPRTLIVEYTNEPWNTAFPAATTLLERAKATWPTEPTTGSNVEKLRLNYYAKRSAQICQLVKTEFGTAASRVKCVVNTQAAVANTADIVLSCPLAKRDLGKACASYFDALAIAPYFAHYVGNLKLRPEITTWYADADGGVARLFSEIMGPGAAAVQTTATSSTSPLAQAGSGAPTGSLGLARSWIENNKKVADLYKLPLWAYEGGQHMNQLPYDKDTQFYNLMLAANRDARMGQAYDQMMADWVALGGQTFVYFTHVDRPSTWGAFGLKESPSDDNAPKWQAALRQRDKVNCWWNGC